MMRDVWLSDDHAEQGQAPYRHGMFAARLSYCGVANDVVAKFLIGRCCLAPHLLRP